MAIVHAMCGASMAHNRIVTRLQTALSNRLGNGPCETFTSIQKLKVDAASDKGYFYPDIMVSCDTSGWRDLWLLNPRLIVEVLSPSTQHIDRREKASTYRRIESMEEYVIAAQSSGGSPFFDVPKAGRPTSSAARTPWRSFAR